jgi:hypothetical protein
MNCRYAVEAFLALGAALLLQGCPNPNVYQTPRTTPKGSVSHTVAAEGIGFSATEEATGQSVSGFFPTLPSYSLRVGVADEVDIGFRLANMSSLGADAKWNFVRGQTLDVAVDPGVQWFRWSTTVDNETTSADIVYANLPVLVGINIAEPLSLVIVPGITYAYSSASTSGGGSDAATSADGVMARVGFGFNLRVSQRFAIQPEVTLLRQFNDDPAALYIAGLGFNFGALPGFDDLAK